MMQPNITRMPCGLNQQQKRHDAITEGVRVNEPGSSNTGWLRITATASGGTELAAISGSSGTAIWTFQSAPTCWCAVSSWLRSTIAR
jgi:hypothetical protein